MNPIRSIHLWSALALLLSYGCGPDFDPPSYLTDLRVLALTADPIEAGPDDQVQLRPHVYLPETESISSQSWSFCPFSLGPSAAYQCALPDCETALPTEADGSTQAHPAQLALACASQFEPDQIPDGLPTEIPEQIDVYYHYQAIGSSGLIRQAVLKQVLWTQGPPPAINQAPRFLSVSLNGQELETGQSAQPVQPGDTIDLRIRIDPDSLDNFVDPAGRLRQEEAVLSLFATAGRFDHDREVGTDITVPWQARELEANQTQAAFYLVARDLRGGQEVHGPLWLPIEQ